MSFFSMSVSVCVCIHLALPLSTLVARRDNLAEADHIPRHTCLVNQVELKEFLMEQLKSSKSLVNERTKALDDLMEE